MGADQCLGECIRAAKLPHLNCLQWAIYDGLFTMAFIVRRKFPVKHLFYLDFTSGNHLSVYIFIVQNVNDMFLKI